MSNFTLKQEGFTSHTAIPNCFIEQYMPYAAGEFVKIYIYLLKCVSENQSELSISKIADAFNNTEKDVVRALKYWQKKGLLKLSFDEDNALTALKIASLTDEISTERQTEARKFTLNVTDAPVPGQPGINEKHRRSVSAVESTVQAVPFPEETVKHDDEIIAGTAQGKEYTSDQISEFSGQEEVQELLFIVHKYLGRTLSGQDTNTILYLYDTLKFPVELIEYLFEYCVSNGHKSIRYIEKTAINWHSAGIRNVKAAKTMSGLYSDECYKVMNAFGISGRKPTKQESDYVSRWTLSYGFDINIIVTACIRTMNQLHEPNFEYTDAILKNWRSNGVTNLDDIKKLDERFEQASRKVPQRKKTVAAVSKGTQTSRFNNFKQRSYDFGMLEQQLFNK